ncbi:tumor necrosis factor receptor superfamily member 10A-like isoform X2 [Rhea pennata]
MIPGNRAGECDEGEYLHEGYCCKSCPAGTYVAQHCNASHMRGTCAPCTEGEDYTAHANGLEKCLPCKLCKDDQITSRTCTLTHDTECQCKQGYFCPAEGCEICQRCSTKCPEGKEIVQNCNATMDLGCGLPGQGSASLIWVIVAGSVCFILVLFFLVFRKLKSDKAASKSKDAEKGLESEGGIKSLILSEVETAANNAASTENEKSGENLEGKAHTSINSEAGNESLEDAGAELSERSTILPSSLRCQIERFWKRLKKSSLSGKTRPNPTSCPNAWFKVASGRMPANHMVKAPKYQIIVKDLSQKELRDTFEAFINEVPLKKWRWLMRTYLKENAIDKIIYDHPNDIREQNYQMLLIWKNTLGEKQSIIKLLDELSHLDIKAYDNVLNSLKSNNIITKLQVTD